MIYELKTAAALAPEHNMQAIHYAALGNTDRVKLVNFASPKVTGRLQRTPFARGDRRRVEIVRERWRPLTTECSALLERLTALLADWGAFLEAGCYAEALRHFFGGDTHYLRRLKVVRDGLELGTHTLASHAADIGFDLTALTRETAAYEAHLCRLLNCLPLRALQWLNLNHTQLQVVTLVTDRGMEAKA